MKVIGKSIGLYGGGISILFSSLGLLLLFAFKALFKSKEFIEGYNEGFLEEGGTLADATASYDFFVGFLSFSQVVLLIFLILGITALVLLILTNNSNKKIMAPFILIIAILHILSFRIVVFVLLLMSFIQLLKDQPVSVAPNTIIEEQ